MQPALKDTGTSINLTEEQLSLEDEARTLGAEAVRAAYESAQKAGRLSSAAPTKSLVVAATVAMHEALNAYIDASLSGRAGKRSSVSKLLAEIGDPWLVAYVTVSVALDSISTLITPAALSNSIGGILEREALLKKFKNENRGLFNGIVRQRREQGQTEANIRFNLKKVALERQEGYEPWSTRDRMLIGEVLLHLLLESSDVFEKHNEGDSTSHGRTVTKQHIILADKYATHLESAVDRLASLATHHMPMVVPPQEWTTPFNGGYLSVNEHLVRIPFGMAGEAKAAYLATLAEDARMQPVYDAVNAVQATPWQINKATLEVAEAVWGLGRNFAGIPNRDPVEQPQKPTWYYSQGCDLMEQEEFKAFLEGHEEYATAFRAWRMQMHDWYAGEVRIRSKRVATMQALAAAQRFSAYSEIYYPHSLDFRGRMYPIAARLSPQGNDLHKGLLRFAVGKPLGSTGAKWLKIHLANTYGVDKVTFAQREEWVGINSSKICDTARNPLDNLSFWGEADSPFCFLAACFEYAGYMAEGDAFVSHLPIALDGTCNGLQNFSAMLRDPIGGAATNLLPADLPQDIYRTVADKTESLLGRMGTPDAKFWMGKINRSLVKRNVMTMPYGATKRGMAEQNQEVAEEMNYHVGIEPAEFRKKITFLTEVVYEAIGGTVVAAREAMDWLQATAKIVAKADLPIVWRTPMGFIVRQDYRKSKDVTIDTNIGTFRLRRRTQEVTNVLDKAKQALGISPNFVHAMDASHLQGTVNLGRKRGIRNFAMIHDSYGTHASDTDLLAATLRDAFIAQYTPNLLADFAEQLAEQVPLEVSAEFPPLPEVGSLDLSQVASSRYFFA